MMKDSEPQSAQANPLSSITRRTHPTLSPETYRLADYLYCCCAEEPASPVFPAPASSAPEPEESPATGPEEKGVARSSGSDTWGSDAWGSEAEGAEAGTDVAAADAEAGMGTEEADAEAGADADAVPAAATEAGMGAPPPRTAEGFPGPVSFAEPFPEPSSRVSPEP
jgi:hypothetical protein